MAEVAKGQLAEIIDGILSRVTASQIATGPHSVQCIGAEISSGSTFAADIGLTNPKLSAHEKPTLAKLARELRGTREAVHTLQNNGTLSIDLQSSSKRATGKLAFARHFYAHEATVKTSADELPPFGLHTWGFSSQAPSTPFSPLALRVTLDRLQAAIRARFDKPSNGTFALAMRAGADREGLAVLASLLNVDALALWHYDEIARRIRTVSTYGMGENRMSVPAGPSESTSRRGIVSQLTPRRIPVIYDAQDPALWRPPSEGSWEPFDVGLFADRGWRSCIAVPIVCGGRLIGALSAYSGSSAVVFEHLAGKLASAAAICADAILVYREDTVIAALAARYEEELLTANVSLSALSLVHDVMHYYRTVQTNVTEAQGYLKTNQLAEAQRTLQDIEQTMTRTGPAINAMRKLATEARSSQSSREPQVTRDVPTVMAELEGLLRAILPHFARSKRLDPEMVTVEVEGPARPVSVPAMTLERIIVNLCVNSAQWNAAQIRVTGHFERSKDDFQLVVRDDGRGIPRAERDRVFDRFFSGRKGSGLGLYVVKNLASRAGGEVYLQSYDYRDADKQRGTVITVVLPTESPVGRGA
ncbi:MAG: ATP-binding protein [Solirubrobacteraceae bacterium]